ncbi:MAG: hypothetical protein ISS93_02395 [Candidatus Aenigmarchaeota archaeon]|nr:hypothetical protein [Candidatus Aenigmarchaeota archaeon]
MKKTHRGVLISFFLIIILFTLFFIPLSYFAVFPGGLIPANEVVLIDNPKEDSFFIITTSFYDNRFSPLLWETNNFKINMFIYLLASLLKDADVFPFPSELEDDSDVIKENQENLFNQSANTSVKLALEYLNKSHANISFSQLAGPSASFSIALELVHQLGDDDLVRGRKIAASGELFPDGHVGEVGTIRQKMITVERGGVDILLLPSETKEKPDSEGIVYVDNLTEAIAFLNNP